MTKKIFIAKTEWPSSYLRYFLLLPWDSWTTWRVCEGHERSLCSRTTSQRGKGPFLSTQKHSCRRLEKLLCSLDTKIEPFEVAG